MTGTEAQRTLLGVDVDTEAAARLRRLAAIAGSPAEAVRRALAVHDKLLTARSGGATILLLRRGEAAEVFL